MEYEHKMEAFNKSLYPQLENVYINAPDELKTVSSTFVKNQLNYDYIPSPIRDLVKESLTKKQ
jgi:phosphopantetheine adenylyltransferase